MKFLKQSTSAVVPMGPFLDKTDGVTLKADATCITDIDHATTGIFLIKNGGTGAIRHQNVTASVADAYGMMLVTLDTTDTNTLGRLRLCFAKAATYVPVWEDFQVLPAAVFDALVTGNGFVLAADQAVNVTKLLGTAPTEGAAGRLAAAFTKFFDKATPTGTINSLPDAVAGANGGLTTTNGTVVNQTVGLTAGQSIACSDKTGFSLSATGADLILKGSTFVQAIVAAINELATYGLTALNTLLVTTGIKAATIPKADLVDAPSATALAAIVATFYAGTGAVATDAGNSSTAFKTNLASAVNDYYKDCLIVLTSGDLVGQVKRIQAYNGTTKFITVYGGFTSTPADAVTFALINK
jgi:hypothetical protein